MTILMVGMQDSVLTLESSKTGWNSRESLKVTQPQSIVFDHQNSNRAYCGTSNNGLWKTDDFGHTWDNITNGVISSSKVMSVSVNPFKEPRNHGFNKVYVGTEPSALYISNDGGESWERMTALNNLGSSKSWSFPPRPWTHHIRWIEPDRNNLDFFSLLSKQEPWYRATMGAELG